MVLNGGQQKQVKLVHQAPEVRGELIGAPAINTINSLFNPCGQVFVKGRVISLNVERRDRIRADIQELSGGINGHDHHHVEKHGAGLVQPDDFKRLTPNVNGITNLARLTIRHRVISGDLGTDDNVIRTHVTGLKITPTRFSLEKRLGEHLTLDLCATGWILAYNDWLIQHILKLFTRRFGISR